MATTSITFRGVPDVEIEYRDHGYESDTGAHDIDWEFTDPDMKDVEVTDEEFAAIMDRLYEIVNEPGHGSLPDDVPISFGSGRDIRNLGTPLSELGSQPGEPGWEKFKAIARSWGYD